jgi:inhibitor of KinA
LNKVEFHIQPLSEHAIIIEFGNEISEITLRKVRAFTSHLDKNPFPWIIEYVPAFTTVTILYDPIRVLKIQRDGQLPYGYVFMQISQLISSLKINQISPPRVVSIPVCYGGELGPDLDFVAKYNEITTDDVIHIHSKHEYTVFMIGFAPGFPYLGGMSKKIFAPRKSTPRLKIPAGSVGIAGNQTGVYPIETPGGWQIIGQTPLELFCPDDDPPSLLSAGDIIKFDPISYQEFIRWKGKER